MQRTKRIGPVSYEAFRQRVRRHRRTDVLLAVAELNTRLEQSSFGKGPPLGLPNVVQPFSLAGVARTALADGNDHRERLVAEEDLIEMCAYYANVEEAGLGDDLSSMRSVLNQIAYEQFGHQYSPMENIGRTLSLLLDHAAASPTAPSADAWADALGVPLEVFMRLGFAMYVAAVANNGRIDRSILKMDHVTPIFDPLDPDAALEVVDRLFAATADELRLAGLAEQSPGLEKWSLSPLVAKPIVALADGRYTMPWPRLIIERITPTGLYFIGLEQFGRTFPDALGSMFESYVGSQLKLLQHAEIRPEVVYGKPSSSTVDYFVITPEVVLIVEVKAARPVRATRRGEPSGDEDTKKKVGYAFTQIERTTQLIRDGHPAVAGIPPDRPLCGLVVTLEPFHLVNTFFYDDVFDRPSIPTAVACAHDLEGTVAALLAAPDVGCRLLEALAPPHDRAGDLRMAAEGLPRTTNPLLDAAWERFSRRRFPLGHGDGTTS